MDSPELACRAWSLPAGQACVPARAPCRLWSGIGWRGDIPLAHRHDPSRCKGPNACMADLCWRDGMPDLVDLDQRPSPSQTGLPLQAVVLLGPLVVLPDHAGVGLAVVGGRSVVVRPLVLHHDAIPLTEAIGLEPLAGVAVEETGPLVPAIFETRLA